MQSSQENPSQQSTVSGAGESPMSGLASGGSPTSSPVGREQQKDSIWLIGDTRVTVRPGKRVDVEKLYPGYVVKKGGKVVYPDETGCMTAEGGATYELKDCLSAPARSAVAAYSSFTSGSYC
ncbi:hypothetical protein CSUI_002603 [Cystoisospora suis]|uniref:Uncharacterized protein n=1 Tax=Cystoisospora suis TaxID=483139 RepID=A0A2C6L5U7_9APIC|nr:hypothetical protein CSUI_002603 [Cystoisospora suis]